MPAIFDVNVLLAVVHEDHEFHEPAKAWFNTLNDADAVVCRVAQLGLLRLLGNKTAMGRSVLTPRESTAIWRALTQDPRIALAFEEPAGLEQSLLSLASARTYRRDLWTDAYLAAFAMASGMGVATFDRGFRDFKGLPVTLLPLVEP